MTPNEIQNIRRFKSQPAAAMAGAGLIDAENGIIHDVIMVQEGPAKGHGVSLDAQFISDITAYDQAHFSKNGLKARFGHPGASDNTMGTQLGVFTNFRKRKNADGKMEEIANLQLLESSNLSPSHPNMKEWVLSMAAEKPDFLMSSIVFLGTGYFQKKANGNKKKVWATDENGNWLSEDPTLGEVFIEFGDNGQHFYTDIVEAGAATETLFSDTANPHLFISQAREFAFDHPHIIDFLKNNPEKLGEFAKSLGIEVEFYKPKPQKRMKNLRQMFAEFLGSNGEGGDEDIFKKNLAEVENKLVALTAEKGILETELATAKTANESLTAANADLAAQLAARDARIVELEAAPAAEHTEGSTENTPPADTRPMSEATARAVALLGRKPKA